MKVLFCGSRSWEDPHPIYLTLAGLKTYTAAVGASVELIHGAGRGADSIAGDMARLLEIPVIEEPADWKSWGRSAGPMRNQRMIDTHEIYSIYAFRSLEDSPGTDDMISRGKKAGIPTYVTYIA